jgi:K+-transporting ATPase A subunit
VKTRHFLVVLLALLTIACGADSATAPSSTSTAASSPTAAYDGFEATLGHGGSSFFSFNVTTAGAAGVMLASVVREGQFPPLVVHLRIGLGVPAGEGCNVGESVDVLPSLTPQLATTLPAGIHCVSVEDVGEVTGTVVASVRFTHT